MKLRRRIPLPLYFYGEISANMLVVMATVNPNANP
jgi:hypothetical protein